ncbi:MAG: M15 family metallopeptidase [Bacteroidales bacterium]|nr:M15 family metallopeptidase [Bacteroidales bacterium]
MRYFLFILILPLLSYCNTSDTNRSSTDKIAAKTKKKTVEKAPQKIEYKDIDKAHLLGHIKASEDTLFMEIPVPVANREGLYIQKEVLKAFRKMRNAAKKDGIHLKIISAYRSFNYQKWIWDSKFDGRKNSGNRNMRNSYPDPRKRVEAILNYSAMPGTSRHHWGTDIDINSVSTAYFESPQGNKVYEWLTKNAQKHEFCQTYTAGREDGYNEEHWHWSYIPLAKHYYYNFGKKISYEDISGFKGSKFAKELNVIQRFVINNINTECIKSH